MLTKVRITNFQSVKEAALDLAPFTVIVGASSSGKSAVLRALRTLAYNSSSSNFVTYGAKTSVIALDTEDETDVFLERGPSVSTYALLPPYASLHELYPKAGVKVPDEVAKVLKFPLIEDESINFAFQFDRPFLLAEPPTKVAKILGDLTNITVIYDAVREANRRRLEASQRLKVRRQDLETLQGAIDGCRGLPVERARLREAKDCLKQVRFKQARVDTLLNVIDAIALAKEALQSAAIPTLNFGAADTKAAHIIKLIGLITSLDSDQTSLRSVALALADTEIKMVQIQQRIDETLKAAGRCPVCGAETA